MEVTDLDKALLREKLKVEEENLFYLRHPYLTMVNMIVQLSIHIVLKCVCLCTHKKNILNLAINVLHEQEIQMNLHLFRVARSVS